jgi:hypothetical protein
MAHKNLSCSKTSAQHTCLRLRVMQSFSAADVFCVGYVVQPLRHEESHLRLNKWCAHAGWPPGVSTVGIEVK